MDTDAVSVAMIPSRAAWRSLLWTIPFTVLWTWLIYSLPVLPESGFPALAVRLIVHGLIALGLWLGLECTDLTPDQRRTTWPAVMVPFTVWAAVAWTAAINGVFRTGRFPLTVAAIGDLPAGDHRRSAVAVVEAGGTAARCDADDLACRSSALPRLRQPMARLFAAWAAARPMGVAGRNWRCADRPVRRAGGDRLGDRHGGGAESGDPLEHLRPRGPRRRDHLGNGHLARPVPADRSEYPEHRHRRLSQCADPCIRGARLDPAARAVVAPIAPP